MRINSGNASSIHKTCADTCCSHKAARALVSIEEGVLGTGTGSVLDGSVH